MIIPGQRAEWRRYDPPMQRPENTRLSQLDAVRGIAAMMVVLYHYTVHYSVFLGERYDLALSLRWGWLGVHFFFMVSGFVIFMTLRRTRTGAEFIVSRFSRLYPAYWLAVLLTATVVNALGPAQAQRSPAEIAVNLTMMQQFLHVPHVDGVYWTLTCELIFYAWMFLLYKLGWLANANRLVACWLGIATISLLCTKFFGYFPWKITSYMLLEYAYLFAGGILFYEVYHRRATATTFALLGVCVLDAALVHGIGAALACICVFFSIFLLVALGRAPLLGLRPLTFLGAISYSLYLLHENMGYLLLEFLHRRGVEANFAVVLTVLTAIALASAVTFLVERPAMNAIRRLYKSRMAPAVQPA